jgi:hypothetical protein
MKFGPGNKCCPACCKCIPCDSGSLCVTYNNFTAFGLDCNTCFDGQSVTATFDHVISGSSPVCRYTVPPVDVATDCWVHITSLDVTQGSGDPATDTPCQFQIIGSFRNNNSNAFCFSGAADKHIDFNITSVNAAGTCDPFVAVGETSGAGGGFRVTVTPGPCPAAMGSPVAFGAAATPDRPGKAKPPRRPLRCVHLGTRTEFRTGCGGWTCRHLCNVGHGEVRPGVECQTCPDYDADG